MLQTRHPHGKGRKVLTDPSRFLKGGSNDPGLFPLRLLRLSIGRKRGSKAEAGEVVDQLSADLRREFPEMHGFSPRNLRYMRSFADAWTDDTILQQAAAKIPWSHNCVLLDKVKEPEVRLCELRSFFRTVFRRMPFAFLSVSIQR